MCVDYAIPLKVLGTVHFTRVSYSTGTVHCILVNPLPFFSLSFVCRVTPGGKSVFLTVSFYVEVWVGMINRPSST